MTEVLRGFLRLKLSLCLLCVLIESSLFIMLICFGGKKRRMMGRMMGHDLNKCSAVTLKKRSY